MGAADNLPDHSVTASSDNTRQLRDALGRFGTGVAIVTTMAADGPAAITINSFASVSLDPALVLWSIDRNSARYKTFVSARDYAIHVLSVTQEQLCMEVARDPSRLHKLELQSTPFGVPVLDECLARFDCATEALHPAGDHTIIVGQVMLASVFESSAPLAFYRGQTGTFAATRPASG